MMNREQNLSPVEFCKRSGLSLGHVYQLLRLGRLEGARKVEGEWRIPAVELERRTSRQEVSA